MTKRKIQRRRAIKLAFALLLAISAGAPAVPQTATVDLQLVLAVDASGSVNQARFELQKQGYAAAFRNPRVLRAIRSGRHQSIVVTMMQWTGPFQQAHVVPWMLIRDQTSADAFADAVEKSQRQLFGGGTSISGAIDYGLTLMASSPHRGLKRVIDISGDGSNNRGRPVTQARDDAVRAGVTINGLPILALEPDLDKYYFDNVIGGPGAVNVPAESYEAFAEAIVKKLIIEIAANEHPAITPARR
jgi:Protein of unknown function (DUF1194)